MAGFVYLCYARVADGDFVERLTQHLAQSGIPVWYDRNLGPGEDWAETVSQKISACSAFIVVMTPEALGSAWVNREIGFAERHGRPLIPILLRGEPFFSLLSLQYFNSVDGSMPGTSFIALLRRFLGEPTPEPISDAATQETVEDAGPTKVFINYRREDSEFAAHWLHTTLTGSHVRKPLPRDSLFIDLGTLVGGDEFHNVVGDAIKQCRIMLVLIGANWLTAADDDGVQRLHLPGDMLREEIEIALIHGLKVIPVLLGQAKIPRAKHLPASIMALQQRHAIRLDPDDFVRGVDKLASQIDVILAKQTPPPPDAFRRS